MCGPMDDEYRRDGRQCGVDLLVPREMAAVEGEVCQDVWKDAIMSKRVQTR